MPPFKEPQPSADEWLHQSLFLKACRCEPTERTPVWFMRQAGRYLKEYRQLRSKYSFLELCKNADLSAEITVQAVDLLGVDAAIIFADLLLIVEPLGFHLEYSKVDGPLIHKPLQSLDEVKKMRVFDVNEELGFVLAAIKKARSLLKPDIPLIGFAGAPYTMACYLIEGVRTRKFDRTQAFMHQQTDAWQALMEILVEVTARYLNAQIKAGVQAVQIFDTWVGVLDPEDYKKFVAPYTKKLIDQLLPRTDFKTSSNVSVIHFGTQTQRLLPLMKEAGGQVMGIDWRIPLDEAWKIIGDIAIMGNLDPSILLAEPQEIKMNTQRLLAQAGGRPGHIFNLGHGILPETPLEHVRYLVTLVKELSKRT